MFMIIKHFIFIYLLSWKIKNHDVFRFLIILLQLLSMIYIDSIAPLFIIQKITIGKHRKANMRSTIYNDNSIFFNGFGLLYFLLFLYSFRYFSKVIPSPIVYYLSIFCYFIRSFEIFFMANDWLSSLEFLYSSLIYVAFFHLIVFSWLYMYFKLYFLKNIWIFFHRNQKFLKTVSVEATINKEGKNCLVNDLKYFAKILLKTPEFFLIGIMWNIGIIILFYLLKFKEVAPFVMVLGILFLAASYFISTMQYFKVSQTPVFQKEVNFISKTNVLKFKIQREEEKIWFNW